MSIELLKLIGEDKATEAGKIFNNILSLKLLEKINEMKKEVEIEEGGAFGKAAADAKKAGKKEFEFEGKTYKVEESKDEVTEETRMPTNKEIDKLNKELKQLQVDMERKIEAIKKAETAFNNSKK